MSQTLGRVQRLVLAGHVKISEHGYDELAADGLSATEVVDGLANAEVIEDYPDFAKGPCVLVLQRDATGKAIHALWGIPRERKEPAVLITAYRPDPHRWSEDFK